MYVCMYVCIYIYVCMYMYVYIVLCKYDLYEVYYSIYNVTI